MNWFGGAGKLFSKVNDIHEKFIEVHTELRLLRHQTESTLSEFKAALERLAAKIETIQLEQVKTHADLRAEIRGLELRINALSEQAFHAIAEKVVRDGLQGKRPESPSTATLLTPPATEE